MWNVLSRLLCKKLSEVLDPDWLCFVVTCRKNWTSSWTVLQGSSLLFAKGQGGSTSWVRIPSAHRGVCCPPVNFPTFFPFHSIHLCVNSLLLLCCESGHPLFIPVLSSAPPWSRIAAVAPSQSCSSLSLAAGSTRSSPVQLFPTVGLRRPPLYVSPLCTRRRCCLPLRLYLTGIVCVCVWDPGL